MHPATRYKAVERIAVGRFDGGHGRALVANAVKSLRRRLADYPVPVRLWFVRREGGDVVIEHYAQPAGWWGPGWGGW